MSFFIRTLLTAGVLTLSSLPALACNWNQTSGTLSIPTSGLDVELSGVPATLSADQRSVICNYYTSNVTQPPAQDPWARRISSVSHTYGDIIASQISIWNQTPQGSGTDIPPLPLVDDPDSFQVGSRTANVNGNQGAGVVSALRGLSQTIQRNRDNNDQVVERFQGLQEQIQEQRVIISTNAERQTEIRASYNVISGRGTTNYNHDSNLPGVQSGDIHGDLTLDNLEDLNATQLRNLLNGNNPDASIQIAGNTCLDNNCRQARARRLSAVASVLEQRLRRQQEICSNSSTPPSSCSGLDQAIADAQTLREQCSPLTNGSYNHSGCKNAANNDAITGFLDDFSQDASDSEEELARLQAEARAAYAEVSELEGQVEGLRMRDTDFQNGLEEALADVGTDLQGQLMDASLLLMDADYLSSQMGSGSDQAAAQAIESLAQQLKGKMNQSVIGKHVNNQIAEALTNCAFVKSLQNSCAGPGTGVHDSYERTEEGMGNYLLDFLNDRPTDGSQTQSR